MATPMTGAQMLAACRKWAVDVHEYPGYTIRDAGAWSDARGIVIHHVGSDTSQSDSYLDFLFTQGTTVPPPLCNVATQMDGDLWLGAMGGRANHAGAGSSATMSKATTGSYDWAHATISPGADDINGNPYYYGNECCFDGGQPMTRAMWVTTVLWCAAVCDFHGWGAYRVIGHKEHTSRKIDPGSTSMPALRRDVHAALTAGPRNWPTPQEESMSAADVQELKTYIDQKLTGLFGAGGTETGRYEQIINENRAQTTTLTAVVNNVIAWLNNDEVEDDFRDQLAGDRWAQSTNEGRSQAASVLADAQAKYVESQAKIDAALQELATIKAQTTPPVEPPPLP